MSAECDKILAWTEEIKVKLRENPFEENDTRRAFVELLYDSAYCYYRGIAFLEMMRLNAKGLSQYNIEYRYFEKHIDRLSETALVRDLERSHFNFHNRSLLIDAWSSFELCATTLVNCIASPSEKENLLSYQFRTLKSELKILASDPAVMNLESKCKVGSLAHVPITRKTDYLLKKCTSYTGNKDVDREFLRFVGKFRNTVHSNFIFHGNNYEYWLNDVHFKFINEQPVVWTDRSTKVYFDLLDRLIVIWDRICASIKFENYCKHPH